MTDTKMIHCKKILIVENDEVNRNTMYELLKNYFKIHLAKDGKEAMELFLQNDYQLIIMDINLRVGKNGIEVMKEIRETDKGKTIPVIAITTDANFGDRESILSEGFDNYISKPNSSAFKKENLYVKINIRSSDEIGVLGTSFIAMSKRIKLLIYLN